MLPAPRAGHTDAGTLAHAPPCAAAILPDTVVPAATAFDCCEACAALGGCAAFTLTPAERCNVRRLGDTNPGCCFLKPAKGWTSVSDNTTAFFTSGQLLSKRGSFA